MSGWLSLSRLPMLKPTLSCPTNVNEGNNMSRFEKLTHVLWHCQYHIVWVPKYRFRVLGGAIGQEVSNCIQVFCSQLGCRIVELSVQPDHVHLLVRVPPKISISRAERGDDTEVCKVSGEARAEAVEFEVFEMINRGTTPGPAFSEGWLCVPPYRGRKASPRSKNADV